MMLPEHVEAIIDHRVDLTRVEQPILDEQEIEAISRLIGESLEDHSPIGISYYDSGFINVLNGIVTKVDRYNYEITLMDYENERHKLEFGNIVIVELH